MKIMIKLFAVAALSLIACGDNNKVQNDAPPSGGSDGSGSGGIPAAPTLGMQIDRLGRPAVSTALDHVFDGSAAGPSGSANAAKDEYNQNGAMGTWGMYAPEFAKNLAILDALDTGVCGNHICEATALETAVTCSVDCAGTTVINGSDGCGNQAMQSC